MATEEMLQANAEGVKRRRKEAAEREAAAARAQEVAKIRIGRQIDGDSQIDRQTDGEILGNVKV